MKSNNYSWNRKFKLDLLLATVILIIPFLIYLHLLFDRENNGIIDIFGIQFEHGFADASIFIWNILSKLIPILLLIIWFHVSPYWWRFFILAPILTYFYLLNIDCLLFLTSNINNLEYLAIGLSLVLCLAVIFYDYLAFSNYRAKITEVETGKAVSRSFYNQLNDQLRIIRKYRKYSDFEYSARLMFLKDIIKNSILLKFKEGKRFIQYTRRTEYLFIIVLLIIPFILFFHTILPKDKSVIDFYLFSVEDNGFKSARIYIWFLAGKASIILPLIIWFYTSKSWRRYAILSPIIIYTYQFWEANLDVNHLDAYGNLKVFPIVLVVILVVVLNSHIFKYRYGILDMYEDINKELEMSIDKAAKWNVSQLKIEADIKSSESFLGNKKENKYLKQLTDLRNRIVLQLRTGVE